MGESQRTRDVGHEFSKYRLEERLSESFLGNRYRAVTWRSAAGADDASREHAGRRGSAYALRLLRADTPSLIDRAARAAKAVRHVDHPNVLAPIQLIRAQTKLGVISQDVSGATLSEVLRLADARGDALPQAVALCIALDVIEGLMALHATEADTARYRYACGGLTPDSVHLGSDGRSRLLDPGVMGAAAGVPYWGHDPVALAYTAPEQTGPEPRFTPETDAFSVGVMLWEMLSGQPLFGARTAAETLVRLHTAPIPRVQRPVYGRGEPVAATLAQVLSRAISRERSQRFASVRELANALRDVGEVATTLTVAEYCQRLASNSGAFITALPVASDTFAEPDEVTDRISLTDQLAPEPAPGSAAARGRQAGAARLFNPRPTSPAPSDSAWPVPVRGRPRYYAPFAIAASVGIGLIYLALQQPASHTAKTAPARSEARALTTDTPVRLTLAAGEETTRSAASAPPAREEPKVILAPTVTLQPTPAFDLAPMPTALVLPQPQPTFYAAAMEPQPAGDPPHTQVASAAAPTQLAASVPAETQPASAPTPTQPALDAIPVAPTFGMSSTRPASEAARPRPAVQGRQLRSALESRRARRATDAPPASPVIWLKPTSAPSPLAAQPAQRSNVTTHSVESLLSQPQ